MRAVVLAIGDEILLGQQLDTNSMWLGAELAALGFMAIEHRSVADDRGAIAAAIESALAQVDVVVVTGGLGPTQDDLTREALGDVVAPGEPLVEDAAALETLVRWFLQRARPMSPINRVQALRPRTARMLSNPNGTAPGLAATMRRGERAVAIFCLPGPPREMQPMFRDHVAHELRAWRARAGDHVVLTMAVAQVGLGESTAAERLGELMQRGRNPSVGTTASGGVVTARIRAEGERRWAEAAMSQSHLQVCRRWAPYAFGAVGSDLVVALAAQLRERSLTLAVAESCTGGLLGATIVECPGASEFFLGGWIVYSNERKSSDLGVPVELLKQRGEVSREAAEAMARGALDRAKAGAALAITGIAGPDGGSETKPVGTVFVGLALRETGDAGVQVRVRHFHITGTRHDVRERSTLLALQMLRLRLMNADSEPLLWEVG